MVKQQQQELSDSDDEPLINSLRKHCIQASNVQQPQRYKKYRLSNVPNNSPQIHIPSIKQQGIGAITPDDDFMHIVAMTPCVDRHVAATPPESPQMVFDTEIAFILPIMAAVEEENRIKEEEERRNAELERIASIDAKLEQTVTLTTISLDPKPSETTSSRIRTYCLPSLSHNEPLLGLNEHLNAVLQQPIEGHDETDESDAPSWVPSIRHMTDNLVSLDIADETCLDDDLTMETNGEQPLMIPQGPKHGQSGRNSPIEDGDTSMLLSDDISVSEASYSVHTPMFSHQHWDHNYHGSSAADRIITNPLLGDSAPYKTTSIPSNPSADNSKPHASKKQSKWSSMLKRVKAPLAFSKKHKIK